MTVVKPEKVNSSCMAVTSLLLLATSAVNAQTSITTTESAMMGINLGESYVHVQAFRSSGGAREFAPQDQSYLVIHHMDPISGADGFFSGELLQHEFEFANNQAHLRKNVCLTYTRYMSPPFPGQPEPTDPNRPPVDPVNPPSSMVGLPDANGNLPPSDQVAIGEPDPNQPEPAPPFPSPPESWQVCGDVYFTWQANGVNTLEERTVRNEKYAEISIVSKLQWENVSTNNEGVFLNNRLDQNNTNGFLEHHKNTIRQKDLVSPYQ